MSRARNNRRDAGTSAEGKIFLIEAALARLDAAIEAGPMGGSGSIARAREDFPLEIRIILAKGK